jgi:hypothetical protein
MATTLLALSIPMIITKSLNWSMLFMISLIITTTFIDYRTKVNQKSQPLTETEE